MKQQLTAKLLNDKIKHGWTATDFAQHLGITSEQFWESLEAQFTRNAYTGFKNSINKNEKHQKRLSRCSQHSFDDITSDTVEHQTHSEIDESIVLEEKTESAESSDSFDFEESTTVSEQLPDNSISEGPSISELEQSLATKKEELNNIEISHKEVVASRLAIKNEISTHKDALEEIQRIIAEHQAALSELILKLDNTLTTLSELTASRNSCRQQIDELTAQLEAKRKVYIFVYNSGEIEWDSNLSFDLPNWSTLFDNIVKENELESLTIKQIKALAQTIALTQFLISIRAPYEVSFENTISENYFKKVIS